MRSELLSVIFCFGLVACQPKHDGYVINGEIRGNSDGLKVMLVDEYSPYPPKTIDSAVIQNGKFLLKGKLAQPGMYNLVIGSEADEDRFSWLASHFYVENSTISYKGHVDSLPTYYWLEGRVRKEPVITGSATQDLYMQHVQSMEDINAQNEDLNRKYHEVYFLPSQKGVFNTAEGVLLAREIDRLSKEREIIRWKFIEKHPESVVGYDLAYQFLGGPYVNLTVSQIDQLTDIITKAWVNSPEMVEKFRAVAQKARPMALGQKYQDIELMNAKGETVKLSEYVEEGKYVMLEFWASWCGPCRGEIPHLRHVYKEYKDKGFEIISISIDSSKDDWTKAMEEEGMVWKQLCDPKVFDGPVAKKYNVAGVPTCILLDKEGRIFKTDMRGAALDAVLEELYN